MRSAILAVLFLAVAQLAHGETRNPPAMAAVGVLVRNGKADCSGSLIAPNTVLTAAHCVTGKVLEGAGGQDTIVFRTGSYPGHPATEQSAHAITIHPLYSASGSGPSALQGTDIALVHLAVDIPSSSASPLAIASEATIGDEVILVTYPGGQGARARERKCPVLASERASFQLSCRVIPGESGGAALRKLDDGTTEIVGVVVAAGNRGHQPYAFVVGAAARVGQLRAISTQ